MDKNYYLVINNKKIKVTEEVYKTYWKVKNKENYQIKKDRENGLLHFSSLDNESRFFVDTLVDESVDIEKIVEAKMRIEDL